MRWPSPELSTTPTAMVLGPAKGMSKVSREFCVTLACSSVLSWDRRMQRPPTQSLSNVLKSGALQSLQDPGPILVRPADTD